MKRYPKPFPWPDTHVDVSLWKPRDMQRIIELLQPRSKAELQEIVKACQDLIGLR